MRELGLPAVLKTRTLGYDGHGQMVLRREEDIERALPLLTVPCILEEFIAFDSEASIVMVADREHVVSFPVGRNIHATASSICRSFRRRPMRRCSDG